jgi:hypothetical protein
MAERGRKPERRDQGRSILAAVPGFMGLCLPSAGEQLFWDWTPASPFGSVMIKEAVSKG